MVSFWIPSLLTTRCQLKSSSEEGNLKEGTGRWRKRGRRRNLSTGHQHPQGCCPSNHLPPIVFLTLVLRPSLFGVTSNCANCVMSFFSLWKRYEENHENMIERFRVSGQYSAVFAFPCSCISVRFTSLSCF